MLHFFNLFLSSFLMSFLKHSSYAMKFCITLYEIIASKTQTSAGLATRGRIEFFLWHFRWFLYSYVLKTFGNNLDATAAVVTTSTTSRTSMSFNIPGISTTSTENFNVKFILNFNMMIQTSNSIFNFKHQLQKSIQISTLHFNWKKKLPISTLKFKFKFQLQIQIWIATSDFNFKLNSSKTNINFTVPINLYFIHYEGR